MGRQIKATGKTVDEAIWNGINELGLTLDEVTTEIIQKGSAGLLGIGSKPAIVMITEKDVESIDIMDLLDMDKGKAAEVKAATVAEPERASVRTAQSTRPAVQPKPQQPKPQPKPQPEVKEESAGQEISADVDDKVEYSRELAKSNEAAQFLTELLQHMDIDAKVLAAEVDDSLKLKIESDAAGVLIGHRGESLDAIQYLTLLVANKNRGQKEYMRISIDTEGYREKREETLVKLAKSKAAAVRANGRAYRFEPMSPYERRIIHGALQGNPHVTTHSEGVEPHRFVVITSNHAQRRYKRNEQ